MVLALALSAVAARPSRLQQKAQEKETVGDYYTAIRMYRQGLNKSSDSAKLAPSLASCYYEVRDYDKAKLWYDIAMRDEKFASQNTTRYLNLLMNIGDYDTVKSKINAMERSEISKYKNLLLSCDSAKAWQKREPNFRVLNVASLNTCYSEFGAFQWQGKLLFSSDRPEITPTCVGGWEKEYMFLSAFQADEGTVPDTTPRPIIEYNNVQLLDAPINVSGAHTGPMTIVPTNDAIMFFTRSGINEGKKSKVKVGKEKRRLFISNLGIFDTQLDDSGWDTPLPFDQNKMQEYSVGHPCFSPNGNIIYFVSDMPGGFGGNDIWYSERNANSGWSKPINCGKNINTEGDELFPTMGKDGTLYFSSDGLPGMGGLDIFKATGSKDKWKSVENMKYPINSSGDDFYLIMTDGDNTRGYLSSNRSGGKGSDDIYAFYPQEEPVPDPEWVNVEMEIYRGNYVTKGSIDSAARAAKEDKIQTHKGLYVPTISKDTPSTLFEKEAEVSLVAEGPKVKLSGRVYDAQTRKALSGAKICATHNSSSTSICKESDEQGEFWFDLRGNDRYTISGFKDGYLSTEPLHVASSSVVEGQVLPVEMQPSANAGFRSTHDILGRQDNARDRSNKEYRVQLLALRYDLDYSYFDKVRSTYPQFAVEQTRRGGVTRYTYGNFKTLAEAQRWMRRYITLGYVDSFVTLFEGDVQTRSFYSSGSSQRVP
jgi:hypothetical protein